MKSLYPTSFSGLAVWAKDNNVPVTEAPRRFVQYALLRAIATSRALSAVLVFKGGNALDFVWRPNRSTLDLDFSVDESAQSYPLSTESLRLHLQPALDLVGRTLGIAFRVQSVKQKPPGPDRHFATFEAKIAYALPDQARVWAQIERNADVSTTVTLEISINEAVCADERIDFGGPNLLRVSTLDDIVAEKLRALLQQKSRNHTRRQDLLDIAVILRGDVVLDISLVSCYLLRKAEVRHVAVSRAAFRDPELAERARRDYDELAGTVREEFVPFEEALRTLLAFVERLQIPENTRFDKEGTASIVVLPPA